MAGRLHRSGRRRTVRADAHRGGVRAGRAGNRERQSAQRGVRDDLRSGELSVPSGEPGISGDPGDTRRAGNRRINRVRCLPVPHGVHGATGDERVPSGANGGETAHERAADCGGDGLCKQCGVDRAVWHGDTEVPLGPLGGDQREFVVLDTGDDGLGGQRSRDHQRAARGNRGGGGLRERRPGPSVRDRAGL